MKKERKISWFDGIFTVFVLGVAMAVNLVLQEVFHTQTLVSTIFIFGVFMISLKTQGYLWGIGASLISVLAVNYAFTDPYFAFDFMVVESLTAAIMMLAVAFLTSTLTTKVKEQERTRAEIEKEHVRANLLRAISHDLRTPLTTIYGSCSAIMENYDSIKKEQKLKLLGEIREDSEWLIRMVENLLSVTRIDGSKVRVVKTETVLEELVDAVVIKFRKRHQVPLEIQLPEDFVSIPMDAVLIEQVLMNLMENAVHHAKGMTKLIFRVSLQDQRAIFAILDDGCGISKERMKHLFTGYQEHTESPMDGRRNNMGIGLSVCSAIVKAHGGTVWAENRKEGGAAFFFSLETGEVLDEQ